MSEIFNGRPDHVAIWKAAVEGETVNWTSLFDGYNAAVDWPTCHFWRELADHYPEAKVILTVRDADAWFNSVYQTLYQEKLPESNQLDRDMAAMVAKMIWQDTFGGQFENRSHAIAAFERHNEEVRRAIPANRLLVHQISEGWEPLCKFLGCAVPAQAFPKANTTAEFQARVQYLESLMNRQ